MEVNLNFKIHRKAKIEENPSKYLDADEEYKEYARGPRSIYWVTNKGKVLSSNWSGIRVMSLHVANDYKRVQILGKMLFVHRLVAQLFIPNNDTSKIEVNHKDSNRANNSVDNLEWVTKSENIQHSYTYGSKKSPEGVLNGKAVLSEQDVKELRSSYIPHDKEFGMKALAKKYGVSEPTINRVVHNRSYKNIK